MTASQMSAALTARVINMCLGPCQAVMPRITPAGWYECDVLAVTKAGLAVEYEVKVSRADYLADRQKGRRAPRWMCLERTPTELKHQRLADRDSAWPSRFYFVMPDGLISQDELPPWAGLIVGRTWGDNHVGISTVRRAPVLHRRRVDPQLISDMQRAAMWRYCRAEIRRGNATAGLTLMEVA